MTSLDRIGTVHPRQCELTIRSDHCKRSTTDPCAVHGERRKCALVSIGSVTPTKRGVADESPRLKAMAQRSVARIRMAALPARTSRPIVMSA